MINKIIGEINKSLENECFISALALSLILPDICGKAEFPDENETKRYIYWYNRHIGIAEKPSEPYGDDMPYSSGELIYNLRCELLHQGSPDLDASKIKAERCKVDEFKIIIDNNTFADSGMSMVAYGFGMKIVKRGLNVNLHHLCNIICMMAKTYYENNIDKFNFLKYAIVDERSKK